MNDVVVPKEAIERALEHADLLANRVSREHMGMALEAAAPLILAANWGRHLVAYASLHETVRRVLAGESNVKYLRKRFVDIEEDLQRAVVAARMRGEGQT